MAAPKRTSFEIARDRAETAKLYLQGKTQAEIAEEMGVSQQQISYDLQRIQEAWQKRTDLDLTAEKAKALARIDIIEREAWDAWKVSRGETEKTQTRLVDLGQGAKRTESTLTKYKRVGNPMFLERVAWCTSERCKILGLYHSDRRGVISIDLILGALPDEFREEVRRQLADGVSERPD
jgi:transcriptional regulator with XRE-family HTH domain